MCSACRRVKLAWYHLAGQRMEAVGWHRHPHALGGTQDLTPGMEEAGGPRGPRGWGSSSLFALVSIGLGDGVGEAHLKLVAAKRHLSVVADEAVEAVEDQVVRQVELGSAGFLPRVDPAVLHPAGPPAMVVGRRQE